MRKKALVYGICLLGTVCTLSAKDKKGVHYIKTQRLRLRNA
ncbi:hypothetical protein BACFIN_04825 [Bacteroides finegoldii DSM 17565]|nr:hypothetical protein BACFIN_04825 [Bacteroides finegoldii DSM 17565]